jgi:hypothetical protein
MTFGLKLGADDPVVLDDAIMYESDASAGVGMWVSIGFSGRSMRGPSGVGDANRALRLTFIGPFGPDFVGESGDLTHGTQGEDGLSFLD